MATPRKPQDRKPKLVEARPDEPFEFEHDGQTYTLAAPSEVLTVGFARKNRHLTLDDQMFTLLEAVADEDTLAAIDSMKKDEFTKFQEAFYAHAGISLGGIAGLLDFLDEHRDAVARDLLAMGLHVRDIGTPRLWWDELRAVIVWAPEGSAIFRAQAGEASEWGVSETLLASVLNVLRVMSWQLSGDAKAPRPEPIVPPGFEMPSDKKVTRGDVMSIEEMDRRLAPYR